MSFFLLWFIFPIFQLDCIKQKSNSLSLLIYLANDITKHKDLHQLKVMVIIDVNLSNNRNIIS